MRKLNKVVKLPLFLKTLQWLYSVLQFIYGVGKRSSRSGICNKYTKRTNNQSLRFMAKLLRQGAPHIIEYTEITHYCTHKIWNLEYHIFYVHVYGMYQMCFNDWVSNCSPLTTSSGVAAKNKVLMLCHKLETIFQIWTKSSSF